MAYYNNTYPDNYHYYYYQQHYYPTNYYDYYQSLPIKQPKRARRLHKSSSTGNISLEEQQYPSSRHEDLNDYYIELDGEPLNELELLALKNADINKKIDYTEEEEPTTTTTTTTVEQVENVINESPPEIKQTTIKKRWSLSFLFKKPTKSKSTPLPPSSPNSESIISSSSSNNTLVAPPKFWAFRLPMTQKQQVWCKFDIENQKKLSSHMNDASMLEIHDSHLPGIPIIVIPSKRIAYYYYYNNSTINYLELALF